MGCATSPQDSTHRRLCPQLSSSGAATFPLPRPPRLLQRLSSYHLPECLSSQHAWEAGKRHDNVLWLGNRITEGAPTASQEPVAEEWDHALACVLCPGSPLISRYSSTLSCKVSFRGFFPKTQVSKLPSAFCTEFFLQLAIWVTVPLSPAAVQVCRNQAQAGMGTMPFGREMWGESSSLAPHHSGSDTGWNRSACLPLTTFTGLQWKHKCSCPGWPKWFCSPSILIFAACVMGLTCSMWWSLLLPYLSYNAIIWYRNLLSLYQGPGDFFQMVETKSVLEMLSHHYPCTYHQRWDSLRKPSMEPLSSPSMAADLNQQVT